MNIEMIKHFGMSENLREAWEALEKAGQDRQKIAAQLRREHPELFDLRKAGDCWAWCFAVK